MFEGMIFSPVLPSSAFLPALLAPSLSLILPGTRFAPAEAGDGSRRAGEGAVIAKKRDKEELGSILRKSSRALPVLGGKVTHRDPLD